MPSMTMMIIITRMMHKVNTTILILILILTTTRVELSSSMAPQRWSVVTVAAAVAGAVAGKLIGQSKATLTPPRRPVGCGGGIPWKSALSLKSRRRGQAAAAAPRTTLAAAGAGGGGGEGGGGGGGGGGAAAVLAVGSSKLLRRLPTLVAAGGGGESPPDLRREGAGDRPTDSPRGLRSGGVPSARGDGTVPLLDAAAVAAAKRAAEGRNRNNANTSAAIKGNGWATDETVLTLDDIGGGGGVAVRFVEIVGLADAFLGVRGDSDAPETQALRARDALDGRRGRVICFDQAKQMFSVMLPPQTDAAAATTTSEGKRAAAAVFRRAGRRPSA